MNERFLNLTVNGLANGAILALDGAGLRPHLQGHRGHQLRPGQFLVVGAFMVYNANVTWGWLPLGCPCVRYRQRQSSSAC